jgi:hypothetical protein
MSRDLLWHNLTGRTQDLLLARAITPTAFLIIGGFWVFYSESAGFVEDKRFALIGSIFALICTIFMTKNFGKFGVSSAISILSGFIPLGFYFYVVGYLGCFQFYKGLVEFSLFRLAFAVTAAVLGYLAARRLWVLVEISSLPAQVNLAAARLMLPLSKRDLTYILLDDNVGEKFRRQLHVN